MNERSVRPPHLLFLSQVLPYPPDGGVKIRTYHVLRLLASRFQVTALCFYRTKKGALEVRVEESLAALGKLGRVEAFPLPQDRSRIRLLRDHLHSLATRRVYTVAGYESTAFRNRLNSLLETERFDIVHADSLDLSPYLPAVEGIPVACTHHDAQSVLLRRRAERQKNPLIRKYIAFQAELMERAERRWCPAVSLNVTVSGRDRDVLGEIAPDARFSVVPNGVDTEYFAPIHAPTAGMVFVGGTTWFPNRDALEYYNADILPALRRAGVRDDVKWVGRASAAELQGSQAWDGIQMTGFVPDVRPFIRGAACYIVPLRVGGGTRIKILDAWAMGKAVVSTSIGCEGLNAIDGDNILIRDDPDSFAEAVRDVLGDSELRQRLGRAARETVEKTYSWDVVGRHLIETYENLIGSAVPAPARVSKVSGG
jgi:polysaccharide biosynthesis protein PslH